MKSSSSNINTILKKILKNDFEENEEFCTKYMSDNNFIKFFPVLNKTEKNNLNIMELFENKLESAWINDFKILEKIEVIYLGDNENIIRMINNSTFGSLNNFTKRKFLRNVIPAFSNFKNHCEKWLDELSFPPEYEFNHINWIKFLLAKVHLHPSEKTIIFNKNNFTKHIMDFKSNAYKNEQDRKIIDKIMDEYAFLTDLIVLYIDLQKGNIDINILNIIQTEETSVDYIQKILLSMISNNWEDLK